MKTDRNTKKATSTAYMTLRKQYKGQPAMYSLYTHHCLCGTQESVFGLFTPS